MISHVAEFGERFITIRAGIRELSAYRTRSLASWGITINVRSFAACWLLQQTDDINNRNKNDDVIDSYIYNYKNCIFYLNTKMERTTLFIL